MNNYRNKSIVLTSICSIGLASISLAQDSNPLRESNQVSEKAVVPQISFLLDPDNQISVPQNIPYENLLETEKQSIDHTELESPSNIESPQDSAINSKATNKDEFLPQALDIIREFEGFREQAYVDTDGTPVIGYGLSRVDGRKVNLGDRISVAKADSVLTKEVQHLQDKIESMVQVELNSNQLSALTSFAFNVGIYGLESSTLLKKLNTGDYLGAAAEFTRWNKATIRGRKIPLAGLTRRREAEKQLFLKGDN